MGKMALRFASLPGKTKLLLGASVLIALTLALPLFIWGLMTQKFDIRKRAQVPTEITTPTPTSVCETAADGTPCQNVSCPPSGRGLKCSIIEGTCGGGQCLTVSPTPTPVEDCKGQSDGTPCQEFECPVCPSGSENCPLAPCTAHEGNCQGEACILATNPGVPPSCPNGDKGNLNCDAKSLINTTDLSMLLSDWRIGSGSCNNGFIIVPAGRHTPDLNGDCSVNSTDLSILLGNWKTN